MSVEPPESAIPGRLREELERDLRPVRPLPAPWRRAIVLLPAAATVLVSVPVLLGLRADAPVLGAWLSWGVSALQLTVGIALVGLALKEAVPGHALSARVVATAIAAAIASVAAVTVSTFLVSPSATPERLRVPFLEYCFGFSALVGTPLVLAAAFLAARALPLRPWIAGALYGLGGGLMADAGWRLFCDVSAPDHVLPAHGGSILTLTLLGALSAVATERIRWRISRREITKRGKAVPRE